MKVILTKEEVVFATIEYLKSQKKINEETKFIGSVESYRDEKFMTISEFDPTVELESKKEEE